jgi:hypothetical protein
MAEVAFAPLAPLICIKPARVAVVSLPAAFWISRERAASAWSL